MGSYANAPVAQMDRVSASEAESREFESRRARQIPCLISKQVLRTYSK